MQGWKTGLARIHDGLYYLPSCRDTKKLIRSTSNNEVYTPSTLAAMDTKRKEENIWLLHQRLGHPPCQILKHMYLDVFQGFRIEHFVCDVCEKVKHKRHSYQLKNLERRKTLFDLIYSDVCRLAPSIDLHGFKWFLVSVDDFIRFSWIYLLKYKLEVTLKVKKFVQIIERQFEKGIKII